MMMNVAARCCCWASKCINTCWMPPWSAVGCHPANIGSKWFNLQGTDPSWSTGLLPESWTCICCCHGNGSSNRKNMWLTCAGLPVSAKYTQIWIDVIRCDRDSFKLPRATSPLTSKSPFSKTYIYIHISPRFGLATQGFDKFDKWIPPFHCGLRRHSVCTAWCSLRRGPGKNTKLATVASRVHSFRHRLETWAAEACEDMRKPSDF